MVSETLFGVAHRLPGYDIVRIALGVLLLTAAGFKSHQLATEPVLGTGLLDSRWVLMTAVEFELLLALALLANVWRKPTWALSLACFGLFAGISLYKALSGHANCGCFGRVPVNPWYTAALDLLVVFLLVRRQPRGQEPLFAVRLCKVPSRGVAVLAIWVSVGAPAAFAMGRYTDTTLSAAGEIIGNDKIIVLRPETWVGRRFPLFPFIEDVPGRSEGRQPLRERLAEGEWLVVLYHHDCPKCIDAIPKYEELGRRLASQAVVRNIALVEVPPYGKQPLASADTPCALGRLSDGKAWFVEGLASCLVFAGHCMREGKQDSPPPR